MLLYMNTKQTLEKIAAAAVVRAWGTLVRQYGKREMGTIPTIVINRRLKTTAGRAWLRDNKIDISERLMLDFPREIIMQTIPHEVAHVAAFRLFNYGLNRGESHGEPWQYIMTDLGLNPDIYHDMIIKRNVKLSAKGKL